jgi:hypothetical protein
MAIETFNHTIILWIAGLDDYSHEQLQTKPAPEKWSIGQVYLHLIQDTRFYLEQIQQCLSREAHGEEAAAPAAQTMFLNNKFPDIAIVGASEHASMPQPASKEQLRAALTLLKMEMEQAAEFISSNQPKSKSKHPGLGYFSAEEWLQFAEMHFQHHLKQKKEIDNYLKQMYL